VVRQAPIAERVEPKAAAAFQSGALSTTYEVQIFRDQRWRVDSMFDDKSLALYEAHRMNDSGRYTAVRVVEEYSDEVTGQASLTTVYRSGSIELAQQKDPDPALKQRDPTRYAAAELSVAGASGTGASKPVADMGATLVIAISGGIVLLLVGALGLLLFS
jgi:hypothetical protein